MGRPPRKDDEFPNIGEPTEHDGIDFAPFGDPVQINTRFLILLHREALESMRSEQHKESHMASQEDIATGFNADMVALQLHHYDKRADAGSLAAFRVDVDRAVQRYTTKLRNQAALTGEDVTATLAALVAKADEVKAAGNGILPDAA